MEDTPDPFDPVRGRRARRERDTAEIWQLHVLHGDHREVYKAPKGFEQGVRDRSVWSDGSLKERF